MSTRSGSSVKTFIVLTRADHLYLYTQLYKFTSKYYFKTYLNGTQYTVYGSSVNTFPTVFMSDSLVN